MVRGVMVVETGGDPDLSDACVGEEGVVCSESFRLVEGVGTEIR